MSLIQVAWCSLDAMADSKSQNERDDSIKCLADSMRDMVASLAAAKDLQKIEFLQSVVKLAITQVGECANFIIAYSKHGFWGETTCSLSPDIMSHFVSQAELFAIAVELHRGHNPEISDGIW